MDKAVDREADFLVLAETRALGEVKVAKEATGALLEAVLPAAETEVSGVIGRLARCLFLS